MEQELREINSNHLSIGKHFDKSDESDAGTLRTKELIFFGLHFQVFFFFGRQAFVLLSALRTTQCLLTHI